MNRQKNAAISLRMMSLRSFTSAHDMKFPGYRRRVIALDENPGIQGDDPVSKDCTPPFAAIWINSIFSRQAKKDARQGLLKISGFAVCIWRL